MNTFSIFIDDRYGEQSFDGEYNYDYSQLDSRTINEIRIPHYAVMRCLGGRGPFE